METTNATSLTNLFSLSAEDFKEEKKSGNKRFRPDAKKGTNNRYEAVVRFLPWWKDPKNSMQSKWTAWMTDPDTDKSMYVDCPSSIGEKSILQEAFFKLRGSSDVREQELSKHFSRRPQYASLVQVLEDKHNPDNVGKIMVYVYGTKVHKKIMSEMQPKHGIPRVPFDVFNGRPFSFDVSLVSGFNNYDECSFISADGFDVTLPDGSVLKENNEDNLQKLMEWLKEFSPDLEAYGFRAWDDETHEFVMSVVRNTIPQGDILTSIEKFGNKIGHSTKHENGDLITTKAPEVQAHEAKAPEAKAPEAKAPTGEFDVNSGFDENLDSFNTNLYDEL